jgi:hypothetical protein
MIGATIYNLVFLTVAICLFLGIFLFLSHLFNVFIYNTYDKNNYLLLGSLYFIIFAFVIMVISFFITRFIISKFYNPNYGGKSIFTTILRIFVTKINSVLPITKSIVRT